MSAPSSPAPRPATRQRSALLGLLEQLDGFRTAQELHGNRLALNVVSGWFKDEYTRLGLDWLDHEERYRRAEEFIEVLRGLWDEDPFTFRGDFYRTRDVVFRPSPTRPPMPLATRTETPSSGTPS